MTSEASKLLREELLPIEKHPNKAVVVLQGNSRPRKEGISRTPCLIEPKLVGSCPYPSFCYLVQPYMVQGRCCGPLVWASESFSTHYKAVITLQNRGPCFLKAVRANIGGTRSWGPLDYRRPRRPLGCLGAPRCPAPSAGAAARGRDVWGFKGLLSKGWGCFKGVWGSCWVDLRQAW